MWDAIAASFDATRRRPWPHVERFLHRTSHEARVLDVMCGNGRHMKVARRDVVGLDFSGPLCRAAAPHGPVVVGDAVRLPFQDASFDAGLCTAGLHGLPAPEDRGATLRELHRVVRSGGEVQITVWSRHAPRFSHLAPEENDLFVPWRRDGHDAPRFYHLYTETTLRSACEAAGFEVLAIDAVSLAEPEDNLVAWLRVR